MSENTTKYQDAFDKYKKASDEMDELAENPDSSVEDFQKAREIVIKRSNELKRLRGETESGYTEGLNELG
jgi:hypothetical protein